MEEADLDEVGIWTEIKLQILREYAAQYSLILGKQSSIKHFAYIDGFAGAGRHISKATGQEIDGSPVIALSNHFDHYHFIDLDGKRAAILREMAKGRHDVTVYEGDCNRILIDEVFPQCRWNDRRRALCLLDPYELNPNWEVMQAAGGMESIEVFLNFMIMDANRNALWTDPTRVPQHQLARMNSFWGDDSWRQVAYKKTNGLFGTIEEKVPSETIIAAYRRRLKEVAGFPYVPEPLPMKNNSGAVIYYLFFASHNKTGDKIARHIFKKYRDAGAKHGN